MYSRSKKSANALIPNGSVDIYSDDSGSGKGLDDLLARKDIQAVDVVLPITHQPVVIKKALKAGKHVVRQCPCYTSLLQISEKPVAPTITEAKELISFYKSLSSPPVWSVAEQFRYNPVYDYIVSILPQIGKFTYFVQQVSHNVNPGDKYFETSWRKTPDYQGGFLLDGGVHFVAGLRKILPSKISQISAFTRLNREYLTPVDTVHATLQLEDGSTGLFGVTFAASKGKYEIELMGQDGSITGKLGYGPESTVILTKDGKEEKKTLKDDNKIAIFNEFVAFGKAVLEGKVDKSGDPEEALADLAVLEFMFKSGEKGAQTIAFNY